MIGVKFDDRAFMSEMNNIVEYAAGFLEGARSGKRKFLDNVGAGAVEELKQFIDVNARMDPTALHHVYEWSQTGGSEGRLFDIHHTVSNLGLSLKSEFLQSQSVRAGSKEPFTDKASIMESGMTVTISPKNSSVLAFDVDGETVFTPNDITVENPGGDAVQGSYERVFDLFMNKYFSQAFLLASGISSRIQNPIAFKNDLKAGSRGGRSVGVSTGFRWIANAGVT
jgi:hypothetical protein